MRVLPELNEGQRVPITDKEKEGKIKQKLVEQRSYVVETDKQGLERKKRFFTSSSSSCLWETFDCFAVTPLAQTALGNYLEKMSLINMAWFNGNFNIIISKWFSI